MRILILSRKETYYATRALKKAAAKRKHSVKIVDPLKCRLVIESKGPAVICGRKKLTGIDVVIPRIGIIGLEYSLSVVRHFESQKIPVLNTSRSITQAKDKFASLQILNSTGLPVPKTILVRSVRELEKSLAIVGGCPVVLKLLKGSQGVGVVLAKEQKSVAEACRPIWALDYDVIIQEFIPESCGQDIRVLVLGGQCIAAMRRWAGKNDFRSNIHQGGYAEKIKLPVKYQKLALRAARVSRLDLAGVDLIESRRGPLIIEVNASPGFEELERVTGIKIAKKIIDFSVKLI